MPDEILGWCYSAFFDGMPTSQLSQYTSFISDHNTHKIESLADFRDKYTQVIASFHAHNFAEQYAALYPRSQFFLRPLPRHTTLAILEYFAELHSLVQDAGDEVQMEEQIRDVRRLHEPNSDQSPFFKDLRDWMLGPKKRKRSQPMQVQQPAVRHRAPPRHHDRSGKENRLPQTQSPPHTNLTRLLHQMQVLNQTNS